MKFKISQTSEQYQNPEKPCEEAIWGEVIWEDIRDFKSIEEWEEHKKKYPKIGEWIKEGTYGHIVTDKGISRLTKDESWFIEIRSLDDLMRFVAKYGEVIVDIDGLRGTPSIEIYDDYRE